MSDKIKIIIWSQRTVARVSDKSIHFPEENSSSMYQSMSPDEIISFSYRMVENRLKIIVETAA